LSSQWGSDPTKQQSTTQSWVVYHLKGAPAKFVGIIDTMRQTSRPRLPTPSKNTGATD
jgi:hypothetical protein